jgi:serine/threonine-protein kinase
MPTEPPADPRTLDLPRGTDEGVTLPLPGSAGAVLPPARVPGYDNLAELGRGGMGVVYKARHLKLNRLVALKMILAGSHAGPTELVRFCQEAETVARLQHPNIVQVYEVGAHDGLPYLALEYVEGGSLAKRTAGAPQPPREAAALIELLARAVAYAHQNGVIHRDLTPTNVLLTAAGAPKLTDFGLARRLADTQGMTATGAVLGTPNYLAPEQASAERTALSPRTDVYGLGAILYYLLTGGPPFQAATLVDSIRQTLEREPVRPS